MRCAEDAVASCFRPIDHTVQYHGVEHVGSPFALTMVQTGQLYRRASSFAYVALIGHEAWPAENDILRTIVAVSYRY